LSLSDETLKLESGDTLVAYTDGLTDTVNRQDEHYGDSRLADTIAGASSAGAREVLAHLMKDVEAFAGAVPQPDDITVLVLGCD
jgi:phosphoserine phosphatase RsbU/P